MTFLTPITLPWSKFPSRMECCDRRVHIAGPAVYWVRDCRTPDGIPVKSANRWVKLYHWQCDVDPSHHGDYWTTTDDETDEHIAALGLGTARG